MDEFIERVWKALEDDLLQEWPEAVVSASAPEHEIPDRRFWIRAGDEGHTLILGARTTDRKDAPAVLRALREGGWIPRLRASGCLKVARSDGGYRLEPCSGSDRPGARSRFTEG